MWQKISENPIFRGVFIGDMSLKARHWTFGILMSSIFLLVGTLSIVKWLTL